MSPAYNYVRNQYLLGKLSQTDLTVLANRNVITEDERTKIIEEVY